MEAPRVWAEVDLDAVARNLALVRSRVDRLTRVLAVLKADAYGHGSVPIARRLVREGIDMIGVGDSSEAIELRRAGITDTSILILGAAVASELPMIVRHDISVCVHSFDRVRLLDRGARALGGRIRVHMKVDTGMGRLGVSPAVAVDLAREILASPHLSLEGICTHLSSADEPDGRFSQEQIAIFRTVLADLKKADIEPEYVHAANTAAVFNGAALENPCFDLVRCGISLYGIDPAGLSGGEHLEPALSLRTQVIFLKDHPAGAAIGYGRTHRTIRPTRIATLPIGYNDGYPFALGGRAWVLVRGRRAPVVGRISMDYAMVDVGHISGVSVGDIVTLVGRDGDDRIHMLDLANWAGTIAYEIPCRFGRRVTRIYGPDESIPGGVPVEMEPGRAERPEATEVDV
jgi:alanine racemase